MGWYAPCETRDAIVQILNLHTTGFAITKNVITIPTIDKDSLRKVLVAIKSHKPKLDKVGNIKYFSTKMPDGSLSVTITLNYTSDAFDLDNPLLIRHYQSKQ